VIYKFEGDSPYKTGAKEIGRLKEVLRALVAKADESRMIL